MSQQGKRATKNWLDFHSLHTKIESFLVHFMHILNCAV